MLKINTKSFKTDLENDFLMYSIKLREEKYFIYPVWLCVCLKVKKIVTKTFVEKWQAGNDLNEMGIVSQSIKCYLVTCIDYIVRDSWF